MQTEQNSKNYIETAKLYKKLVTSTKVMERLSVQGRPFLNFRRKTC